MKKVIGYINVRALGTYDFEFYVDDDYSAEEIKRAVDNVCQYYITYDVEEGYVKREITETVYVKEN